MPTCALMVSRDGGSEFAELDSDFFPCLIADILRFFDEKKVSFDTAETLEAIRLRDGALAALPMKIVG